MANIAQSRSVPYISEASFNQITSGYDNQIIDLHISYTVQFMGFQIITEVRGLEFQNYSSEEFINLLIDKIKSELP